MPDASAERWRQEAAGIDPARSTDLLAEVEAHRDEKAVEALGQQLRFFLSRWQYVHPQQFDTEAGEALARDVLARFQK